MTGLQILLLCLMMFCFNALPAQQYFTEDAERFARIFNEYNDSLTGDIIQDQYLDPGTEGIKIFTPGRIQNASHMKEMVDRYYDSYEKGVTLMLPAALKSADESARVLEEIRQLLLQEESVPVYILFGANNSGGTTSRKGLAIGLEVLGRFADTEEEAQTLIKDFVAHEVVHVYQTWSGNRGRYSLLHQSLREGYADFIQNLVMGGVSAAEKERHAYGLENEAKLWTEFKKEMHRKELQPWMYGEGKDGRPSDLGYWLGKRICEAYYSQSENKQEALLELLRLKDPAEILKESGYDPR